MRRTDRIVPIDKNWQSQLRELITSRDELLAFLGLHPEDVGPQGGADAEFALKVPMSFAARMKPGDPRDPLLLQVLSTREETLVVSGYTDDPLEETGTTNPLPGLVHKYHGRVLLIVAGACAVNCRYCFRRHFPYEENRNNRDDWNETLAYIAADNSIEEVIFSGGDPLVVTDSQLAQLVEQIAAIDHVKRLRIHSRLPIVIPQRVTQALLSSIMHPQLQTIMVVHCNHANEIDGNVARAFQRLRDAGITVLNQAVLLRHINDRVAEQVALNRALFECNVLPYYLHLLDKVQGAAHFDVPEPEALELIRAVGARLPGYMVPKLVREEAGGKAKTVV